MTVENTPNTSASSAQLPKHIAKIIHERQRRRSETENLSPDVETPVVRGDKPWRGLLLGLIGICALSFISPYAYGYLQASELAATYLPTGVFLLFLLILGLNTILIRLGMPLSPREIMLAYVTMLIPSAIPTTGLAMRVTPLLVNVYYYATPVNEWSILHHPHIPKWMTPQGADVARWYFTGLPEGASIPWGAWIQPLAIWSLLAAGLYLIILALSITFRKRWMDAERLQFPLAQVPLMVMGDDPHPSWLSRLFRNPLLWIGFAIPFFFHGMNGLHVYFPVVPPIKLTALMMTDLFSGSQFLMEPPFYRWAGIRFNFYWSVIGISYLLRSEVSLSVWVFEWLYRLEEIVFEISGIGHGQHNWSPLHTFGYSLSARYQRVGAIIVASSVFLYASRNELREMMQAAFGRRRLANGEDTVTGEAEIPWWTFWVMAVGFAIYYGWTYIAGLDLVVSTVLLVIFLLLAVTAARIVAATGLLWVYDFFVPMQGLQKILGTARISPQMFTMVAFVDYAMLGNRTSVMPQTLDGMKIARETGITQKHFFLGMALGIIAAVVISFGMVIWMGYTYGGINLENYSFEGGGNWVFNRVAGFQRYHVWTDWTVMGIMAAGGGFMGGLMWLHRTFLWWPLYPLGFIIGGTVASGEIWFPVFLGWLAKVLVIKFAGAHSYNRFKVIALGLLIGEFVAVGLWLAIDWYTGTTMHLVFPHWRFH